MEKIEWEDVQRIVLSGYKHLPLFRLRAVALPTEDARAKKDGLRTSRKRLTPAVPDPSARRSPPSIWP